MHSKRDGQFEYAAPTILNTRLREFSIPETNLVKSTKAFSIGDVALYGYGTKAP
jgi:hypothetical protein